MFNEVRITANNSKSVYINIALYVKLKKYIFCIRSNIMTKTFKAYNMTANEKTVFISYIIYSAIMIFADMIISPVYFLHMLNKAHISYADVAFLMGLSSILIGVLDFPTSHIADKSNKLLISCFGTTCICVMLMMVGFATNMKILIVAIVLRAVGAAMETGCLSGWFVDNMKDNPNYEKIKEKYISYSTIATRFSMFASLVLAFFLLNKVNPESIFVVSSIMNFLLLIFVFSVYLKSRKTGNTQKSNIKEILEIRPLIDFCKKTISNRSYLKLYGISFLRFSMLIIFITFWHMVGENIGVGNQLSILHIIAMGSCVLFSVLVPKIEDRFKDKKNLVIAYICLVLMVTMVASTFLIKTNKYFYVFFLIGFQVTNVAFGMFNQSYSMRYAAEIGDTSKFFSIVSSIGNLLTAIVLFLIKEFIVDRIPIMGSLCLLLIPGAIFLVIMMKNYNKVKL